MDLLYESDQRFGEMEETQMESLLDDDVFQSPSSTSSDGYMDNDWLNSLFEDPVLNDKMITDAIPAPRIHSEHSYSIHNDNPDSPLGLGKLEDLDTSFFGATSQALDLSSKQALGGILSSNANALPIKQEPLDLPDALYTSTQALNPAHTYNSKQPTIILATTSSPLTQSDKHASTQIITCTTTTSAKGGTRTIVKTEPSDLLDSHMEQTMNVDSLTMPPTPPSSASSDSEGSQSPQRSAPSSPIRHQSKHSSPSSSKPYSQSLFSNSVSLLSSSYLSEIPQSGVLMLTEEEKRTLVSEGYPIPSKLPLTKQEEKNLKKIRRKIKNKISAQESRRKKKEYLEALEKRVEAFSQENNDLKKKVDSLENNNRSLLGQLQKLQSLVSKVTRPGNGTTQTGTVLMVLVLCFAVFLGGWGSSPSLNVGYSPGSALNHPTFFGGQPRLVQPSRKMGPPPQEAMSSDYSTPNMKSRLLLSCNEDSTNYEPYAPYVSQRQFMETGNTRQEVSPGSQKTQPPSVTNTHLDHEEDSPVSMDTMGVVTVGQSVHRVNNTSESDGRTDQALLHPDIEAGFYPNQGESSVENA